MTASKREDVKSDITISDLNREFERLRDMTAKTLAQIDDQQFFQTLDSESNSVAIIIKHMAGNMLSRWRDFLTSDGEKPDRQRDQEFVIAEGESRASIMARSEKGWETLFGAIRPLEDTDLQKTVYIRGEPLTVFQAIVRQLGHYSYHVGQIVLLARHFRGDAWQTLSIAKGKSAEFNQRPKRYLRK